MDDRAAKRAGTVEQGFGFLDGLVNLDSGQVIDALGIADRPGKTQRTII